jgi:hypothetical protein
MRKIILTTSLLILMAASLGAAKPAAKTIYLRCVVGSHTPYVAVLLFPLPHEALGVIAVMSPTPMALRTGERITLVLPPDSAAMLDGHPVDVGNLTILTSPCASGRQKGDVAL